MIFAENLYISKVVDKLLIFLVSKFYDHRPFWLRATTV
jgi:hypothetical protein